MLDTTIAGSLPKPTWLAAPKTLWAPWRLEGDIGIHHLFDDIVCSAEVGMAKPEPAIYELAAERLGLEPRECVFVDDLDTNVDAARQVGMQAVLFRKDKGDDLRAQLATLGVAPRR